MRVLRPARPRFRFGLTRAPHESPTSGGYRRIHIRRRGRVLRNSPPPASVRSANRPEPWPRMAPSGVRRGARGLGLPPTPCAAAPVVFAVIRAAMLRRRNTAFSPCDVSHRASDEPRRRMSLSSALAPSSLASPSIRRVFLRSFCARRRSVSSLNLARVSPGAKRSRRRRAQCGVQIYHVILVGAPLRGARFSATNPSRFRPHHNLISPRFDFLILRFDGERADVV